MLLKTSHFIFDLVFHIRSSLVSACFMCYLHGYRNPLRVVCGASFLMGIFYGVCSKPAALIDTHVDYLRGTGDV